VKGKGKNMESRGSEKKVKNRRGKVWGRGGPGGGKVREVGN